jgi:predicted MFS family arabinose efflux permease
MTASFEAGAAPAPATPADTIPRGRLKNWRHYTLALLCIVAVFNYIDRQVLSILLTSVKQDLNASDTAMGLLNGMAFAAFYVVAGIPLARWADRGNRRLILSLCLGLWSVMTMLCGAAQSFWQLAAARVGVASGEAGASPATQSMLADLYGRSTRATALAIWIASSSVGIAFGMFFGGWLNEHFSWRLVFLIVGAPGVILAALFALTVREPAREMRGTTPDQQLGIIETLKVLWQIRSFRASLLVASCASFSGYAYLGWSPTYFIRIHHLGTTQIGLFLGLSTALGLVIGNLAAGRLADLIARRDPRGYFWVAMAGLLISLPAALAFTYLDSWSGAMIAFFVFKLAITSWNVPLYAAILSVARPSARGLSTFVVTIFTNIFGFGLGPLVVGALNDALTPAYGAEAIRYSMAIVSAALVIGVIGSAWGLRWIRHDIEDAERAH